jgi:hypothetical protein
MRSLRGSEKYHGHYGEREPEDCWSGDSGEERGCVDRRRGGKKEH